MTDQKSSQHLFSKLNRKARWVVNTVLDSHSSGAVTELRAQLEDMENDADIRRCRANLKYYLLELLISARHQGLGIHAEEMFEILLEDLPENSERRQRAEARLRDLYALEGVFSTLVPLTDKEGNVCYHSIVNAKDAKEGKVRPLVKNVLAEFSLNADTVIVSPVHDVIRALFKELISLLDIPELHEHLEKFNSPYKVSQFFSLKWKGNFVLMQLLGKQNMQFALSRVFLKTIIDPDNAYQFSFEAEECPISEKVPITWRNPVLRLIGAYLQHFPQDIGETTMVRLLNRLGFAINRDDTLENDELIACVNDQTLFTVKNLDTLLDSGHIQLCAVDPEVSQYQLARSDNDLFFKLCVITSLEMMFNVVLPPEQVLYQVLRAPNSIAKNLSQLAKRSRSDADSKKFRKVFSLAQSGLLPLDVLFEAAFNEDRSAILLFDQTPNWYDLDISPIEQIVKAMDPSDLLCSESETIIMLETQLKSDWYPVWLNRYGQYWKDTLGVTDFELIPYLIATLRSFKVVDFTKSNDFEVIIVQSVSGAYEWDILPYDSDEDPADSDKHSGITLAYMAKIRTVFPLINLAFQHEGASYSVRILEPGDLRALTIGLRSACCQSVFGAAFHAAVQSYTRESIGVVVIESEAGELLAQSLIYEHVFHIEAQEMANSPLFLAVGPHADGWTLPVIKHALVHNHLPIPEDFLSTYTPDTKMVVFDSIESRFPELPSAALKGYQLMVEAFCRQNWISVMPDSTCPRSQQVLASPYFKVLDFDLLHSELGDSLGYSDFAEGRIVIAA